MSDTTSPERTTVRLGAEGRLDFGSADEIGDVERRRIEAWLAALIQAEHVALLVGNGLSSAIGHVTGVKPPSMWRPLVDEPFGVLEKIRHHAEKAASAVGRDCNLEDEIRAAMTLAAGLEVLGNDTEVGIVEGAIERAMSELLDGVEMFERGIWEVHRSASPKGRAVADLLLKLLTPFVSRPVRRDRLHLFTTNYDRLLEYAADVVGLRMIDRFEGQLSPRFTASRLNIDIHYTPPGVRGEPRLIDGVVRYSKLHGSIDWRFDGSDIVRAALPFGGSRPAGDAKTAVIYPNPAKDVETLAYPYAELFRDFAAAVCRPNTTLVTYGYGFGDSHINRVIADMLRVPSTHLVVVTRDPLKTLSSFKERNIFPVSQTTEMIGPVVGGLDEFASLLPSLTSATVLDAQFDYLDRRARIDGALGPSDRAEDS
ncbi:SIR2 family protein [Mycobacterium sp. AMU20-3851]|uniref:SIR2 family protein n=1 Tax=Mycobacterium sp. AMU20-3851 TaxID=3122055 RepID=UPI003753EE1A